MPHLEPTYLRYIYDGLIKGSIHPENAAELPEGLIGLYEEAFDERQPVHLRQKLLQRFAIWALFKKEVSTQFIAEVLNQQEEEIQDFIAAYSAWFNSPESGKYQLYHERLKIYFLQKLSEGEVHILHEKLISRLERAIEEQKADEFEWYGLEFYASHLCVSAKAQFESGQNKLIDLAQNESFKTRQYMMSASFEWTYTSLDQIKAHFFSINDLDNALQIEILFAQVYHKEKNSFSELLTFIEKENLDLFIKRYQALKGESKAEIENFFYLSILVLTKICEHTFSSENSKNQFLLSAAKVLDDSIPNDPELFDWDKIISAQHVIGIIENLARIDLDKILLSRTKLKIDDWLAEEEKKQQALLEKNQAKNDEAAQVQNENLPPQDFDKIRGKRKRVEAQIEFLKSLRENGEMERAWELVESIKVHLVKFPSFSFRIPYAINGLGITRTRKRNSSWYYGHVIDAIGYESLSLNAFLNQLRFFQLIDPKDYKKHSSWHFSYYLDDFKKQQDKQYIQIVFDQNKNELLTYVYDILDPEIEFKPEEPRFYEPLISTLILLGEFKSALNIIEQLSIEFDFDDSTIIDNIESWRISIYSKWTLTFLEKGQFDYVTTLLGKLSLPYFKDIIRKTISSYQLTIGNIYKAVHWALEVSEDKIEFIKYLSSQISTLQMDTFIHSLLNFYPKMNFATSVIDLIEHVDDRIIKITREESANFWGVVWFLLLLNQKERIDDFTFKSQLKSLIDNIPANDIKVNFCVQLYGLLCVHKKEKEFDFLLRAIRDQKKIENINSDAPWGANHHDLFKNMERKILAAVDLYEPFNFQLKLKILFTIHTLNLYRPINSKSVLNYFLKSILKTIYRFFYYIMISIKVTLFPQLFSKYRMNINMKKVAQHFEVGNLVQAIKDFLELEKYQIHPYKKGTAFLEQLFSKMQAQKEIVDCAVVCGYSNAWTSQKQKEFILDYLNLEKSFDRNKAYYENLNHLLNPSSISKEALIKSAHYFQSNRNFRFNTLYKYAVQTILTTGQVEQFDKMMNLDVYKNIYNTDR